MHHKDKMKQKQFDKEEILWLQVEAALKKREYFGLCRGCEFNDQCVVAAVDRGTWNCGEYEKFVNRKTERSN